MSIAYLDGKGPVKEYDLTDNGCVGCWNCGSMHLFLGLEVDPQYSFMTRAFVECNQCGHRGHYQRACKFEPNRTIYIGDKWDKAMARAKAAWNFECTGMSSFWNMRSPCRYNWGY